MSDAIEGESNQVGVLLATIVRDGMAGRGGRNSETLLAAAIRPRGKDNVWALAGDTDGIDGFGEAAGAIRAPDTLMRAQGIGARCAGIPEPS